MKKNNLLVKVVFSLLMVVAVSGFIAPNTAHAYKIIHCECDDGPSVCATPWWRGCRHCCATPLGIAPQPGNDTISSRLTSAPTVSSQLNSFSDDLSSITTSVSSTSTSRLSGSTAVEPLAGLLYRFGFLNPGTSTTTGDLIVPTSIDNSITTGINNLSTFLGLTADGSLNSSDYSTISRYTQLMDNAFSQLPSNTQTVYTIGGNTLSVFSPTNGVFGPPNVIPSGGSTGERAMCCQDYGGCEDMGDISQAACKAACGFLGFCVLY